MARIYSKVERNEGGIDVIERERTPVVRASVRESRDAEADRGDVRLEGNPGKWINPTSLDAPEARSGFVQKWISDGSTDSNGVAHWMKKMREGWAPRSPETVPAAQRRLFQTAKGAHGEDVIRVAGLVLCEMPRNVAKQRYDAVRDMNAHQLKSIAPSLQELRSREGAEAIGPIEVTDSENGLRGRRSATMVD